MSSYFLQSEFIIYSQIFVNFVVFLFPTKLIYYYTVIYSFVMTTKELFIFYNPLSLYKQ